MACSQSHENSDNGLIIESLMSPTNKEEEKSSVIDSSLETQRWQVRRQSRWVDLPPNVGRSLDVQMSQRLPTSEVVVFDEKRYEIRARERRLVDLSHRPPQTFRIRRLRGGSQGIRRTESSCSIM